MINCTFNALPDEKEKQVRDWLKSPARLILEDCIRSEIAELQAKATNGPMQAPLGELMNASLMEGTKKHLQAAAPLQIFLQILESLEKAQLRTVKLTVN